jgi:hypothetical protein
LSTISGARYSVVHGWESEKRGGKGVREKKRTEEVEEEEGSQRVGKRRLEREEARSAASFTHRVFRRM